MTTKIWPAWQDAWTKVDATLEALPSSTLLMPGISDKVARETLATQIVASLRRMAFTEVVRKRDIHLDRSDPTSDLFDPERAAVALYASGNLDEAVWLIFLATHFGKHARHGWRRLRDVYGALGGAPWTWTKVAADVGGFRSWLEANRDAIGGKFGNHRKYESLSGLSDRGTGEVFESYVEWIGPARSHKVKFSALILAGGNDPHSIFDVFYNDMQVARFGRLGKFDFLAHIGRLRFAPIAPGSAYLNDATGPLRGARLLFADNPTAKISAHQLQEKLDKIDEKLGVGMQVLEDAICNWQKSPVKFVHFKG